MNTQPDAQPTSLTLPSTEEQPTTQNVPIEVKWNLPAWMMRDPGPAIDIEDDQFEEG